MMENKYAEGLTVYAVANPEQELVVRRFVKRIYYCTDQSSPNKGTRYFMSGSCRAQRVKLPFKLRNNFRI